MKQLIADDLGLYHFFIRMDMACFIKNLCFLIICMIKAPALPPRPSAPTQTGLRRFFVPHRIDTKRLIIRGIGIGEQMPATMIDRPNGTGDCLFMLFHDQALMGDLPFSKNAPDSPASSMIIWPTHAPQHYGNRHRGFSHSWIHCDGRRVKTMLKESGLPLRKPFVVPPPAAEHFQRSLHEIYTELVSFACPEEIIAGNLLENALFDISRSLQAPPASNQVEQRLLAVRRHLGSHYAQPIDLHTMAAMAGMSVPYFCARFKAAFQITPMASLIQQRMQHASYLLSNPSRSIAEIACEVGYNDAFHFSKMFKRHFGVNPRALRKRQLA